MTLVEDPPQPATVSDPDWNGWILDRPKAIVYRELGEPDDPERQQYGVPLAQCLDSAQVLNWVAKVSRLEWATPRIIAGLVWALDDIIDLRARLCAHGHSRSIGERKAALLASTYEAT